MVRSFLVTVSLLSQASAATSASEAVVSATGGMQDGQAPELQRSIPYFHEALSTATHTKNTGNQSLDVPPLIATQEQPQEQPHAQQAQHGESRDESLLEQYLDDNDNKELETLVWTEDDGHCYPEDTSWYSRQDFYLKSKAAMCDLEEEYDWDDLDYVMEYYEEELQEDEFLEDEYLDDDEDLVDDASDDDSSDDDVLYIFSWTEDEDHCYLEDTSWYSDEDFYIYRKGAMCDLAEEYKWDDLDEYDDMEYDDDGQEFVHFVDPLDDLQLHMKPNQAAKYLTVQEQPNFLMPHVIPPAKVEPIYWRDSGVRLEDDELFAVGLPPELLQEFRTYFDKSGVLDLVHQLLYNDTGTIGIDDASEQKKKKRRNKHKKKTKKKVDERKNYDAEEHKAWTLADGHKWSVKRADHWKTDMVWFDPIDETCYESLRAVLRRGNFQSVVDSLRIQLREPELVVHGVGAIFLGRFEGDTEEYSHLHRDIPDTRGAMYNVLVPIYLPHDTGNSTNSGGEHNSTNDSSLFVGGMDGVCAPIVLKYNTGLVVGSDSWHGTGSCDYRSTQGYRMSMSIWLSTITEDTLEVIATDGLSPWPLHDDKDWYWAQKDRSLLLGKDKGRAAIGIQDQHDDCAALKNQCETDLTGIRSECEETCQVYMTDSVYSQHMDALLLEETKAAAAAAASKLV